jgi:hypothetical protein
MYDALRGCEGEPQPVVRRFEILGKPLYLDVSQGQERAF